LVVRAGEVLCVLGASGCGKTTLLRILAGLDQPTSGSIRSDLARPGPALGYLQQGETLFSWRSVLQNVALGGELLGRPRKLSQRRARESLESVALGSFADAGPRSISGGMTQRVLVARLLSTDPKLLLLDEPLGQLDLVGRRALAKILKEYTRNSGAATVVVTHSVEEAVFLGDRVCILSQRPATLARGFALSPDAQLPGFELADKERPYEQILDATLGVLQP